MTEIPQENLSGKNEQTANRRTFPNREAMLELLARAADDQKFLARLAENPYAVLLELQYYLNTT